MLVKSNISKQQCRYFYGTILYSVNVVFMVDFEVNFSVLFLEQKKRQVKIKKGVCIKSIKILFILFVKKHYLKMETFQRKKDLLFRQLMMLFIVDLKVDFSDLFLVNLEIGEFYKITP